MLGLIVVAVDGSDGLAAHAVLDELLGVPVLARSIAGALPADESVTGVLVVPQELCDKVQADVVERFGFDEIDRVVSGGPGMAAAVQAGLSALPDDVETVIVQHGAQALCPMGLVERVVQAARDGGAAAPGVRLLGTVVNAAGDDVEAAAGGHNLRQLQGPQAFAVGDLKEAVGNAGDGAAVSQDPAQWALAAGGKLAVIDGDADNMLLRDAADVGRAIEVFSRRAVEFPFVYPRDLLPDDPLADALAPGDSGEGQGASE